MQKLLIVVDTQYDFMMKAGKLPIPGAEEMIGPMITYLATLDPGEYPYILFTFDTHDEAEYLESEEGKQFPMHCDRHSNGWKNVLPIEMTPDESNLFSLEKKVFSMFEESNVITHELGDALPGYKYGCDQNEFLEYLRMNGVDTITVIGGASDFCVKMAVDGLVERNFNVEVIDNLTRGIFKQSREVFNPVDYPTVKVI